MEAVSIYREALQIIAEYDKHKFINIDKLQRIHTLYNLNEVLSDKNYPSPPPTLRDDKLLEECELVQRQYMEKYINETRSAYTDVIKIRKHIKDLKKKIKLADGEWVCELVDWLMANSLDDELIKRIQTTMDFETYKVKVEDISGIRNVAYMLTTWLDKVSNHHQKVYKQLDSFEDKHCSAENQYNMTEKIVNDAMECHLRPTKKKIKRSCVLCLLDITLKKYECFIFKMKGGKVLQQIELNEGRFTKVGYKIGIGINIFF